MREVRAAYVDVCHYAVVVLKCYFYRLSCRSPLPCASCQTFHEGSQRLSYSSLLNNEAEAEFNQQMPTVGCLEEWHRP